MTKCYDVSPFLASLKPLEWNENRKYVKINDEAIEKVAATLAEKAEKDELKTPNWREECFPANDNFEEICWFFLVAGSINFAFTNFQPPFKDYFKEYKGKTWTGSLGMAAAITAAVYDYGIPLFDADYLADIKINQLIRIFAPEKPPLIEKRTANLRILGKVLKEKYQGQAANVFRDSDFYLFNGGSGFIGRLISDFREIFQDFSWHGPSVSFLQFHKLANLIPIVYQGRALASASSPPVSSGGGLPLFKDPHLFYPPADYSVPKALNALRILAYHPVLKSDIENLILIERDSLPEQEIRAVTVLAMYQLLRKVNGILRNQGQPPITMAELDGNLWLMSKSFDQPHHLTITTAY